MAQDIKVALTLDNKQFNKGLAQSQKKTKQFSKEAKSGVSGLTKAFAGLFAAIGVGEIIKLGDEFTNLNNRLKAVTGSSDEAAKALRLVTQVAADSRSSLSATAGLYADLIIATKDLGTSQAEIADITRVFGQTLAISGADAAGASGAIRQFGQALASGVLRGEEFNSMAENNSAFMLQFADALGKPIGELRALAKEGALTADVILAAVRIMKDKVQKDFDLTAVTVGQAFTSLRNATLALFGSIESETGVMQGLASAIESLAKSINNVDVGKLVESFDKLVYAAGLLIVVFGAGGILGLLGRLQGGFIAMGTGVAAGGKTLTAFGMIAKNTKSLLQGLLGVVTLGFMGGGKGGAPVGGLLGSIGKVLANVGRLAVRFLGPIAGVIGILELLSFASKKLGGPDFMKGPRDAIIDFSKGLLGFETAAEKATRELEELNQAEEDAAEAAKKKAAADAKAAKAAEAKINLEKTYAHFLSELNKKIITNVRNEEFRLQAIDELTEAYESGLMGLDHYVQAMKILNETLIDVDERLKDARSAVTDFNNEVLSGTNDLQKELDQLNMTAFQKSQDDIKRDLEELRDETLKDLKDELEGLDVNIDADAIKTITDQMDAVTIATQAAIIAQQDLGKQGYDASRLFSTGWDQALTEFKDNIDDKASKAKEVFETFTKGVEDAFVNFAKTGKLSFKDLLDSMVEMLIRSQIQNLMSTLLGASGSGGIGDFFSKIFGKAQGGPVQGGTPYMVGEQGPELFVPNNSGQITPNNKLGGGGTVNNTYITNSISAVDAKSVAQLFAENRKTLLGTVQMAQNEMPYG